MHGLAYATHVFTSKCLGLHAVKKSVEELALMPANGVRVRAAIRTWVAWVSALLAA